MTHVTLSDCVGGHALCVYVASYLFRCFLVVEYGWLMVMLID